MDIIKYNSLDDLKLSAAENGCELIETDGLYLFRIFRNKDCIELHIYYKILKSWKKQADTR